MDQKSIKPGIISRNLDQIHVTTYNYYTVSSSVFEFQVCLKTTPLPPPFPYHWHCFWPGFALRLLPHPILGVTMEVLFDQRRRRRQAVLHHLRR